MSQLAQIHHLLQQEYCLSRHLFWQDENNGQIVNDVTECLKLIVAAAQELRQGKQSAWEQLIRHCLDRAMSGCLLIAIDEYLRSCGDFPPLPVICFHEDQPHRNWRGGTVPLLDETDQPRLSAYVERPEMDRQITFMGEHQWSLREPRLTQINPHHAKKNETKATHWLYA